jgi:hypothetical protein
MRLRRTTKNENTFVGRNLINMQQNPCTLLQVLVNYGIVADCGESATQRFNFILTTDNYFQIKKSRKGLLPALCFLIISVWFRYSF